VLLLSLISSNWMSLGTQSTQSNFLNRDSIWCSKFPSLANRFF
jgi:hypothetical protein